MKPRFDKKYAAVKALFALAVLAHILVWAQVRDVQAKWINVPPVPGEHSAAALTLGDKQFAYRAVSIMLQNLGDSGGRVTNLNDYDYEALTKWFFLADSLDPKSDFVPFLASYYYSALTEGEKYRPVLDYLHAIGTRTYGQKWRFLAQGAYIARYDMNDLDTALKLAYDLAAVQNPDMPAWPRQMPAFILSAQGEKEAALGIMVELLKSNADKMDPAEVRHTIDFICERLLDEREARGHPLCQNR